MSAPAYGVSSRGVQSEALSLRGMAERVRHSIFIVLILLLDTVFPQSVIAVAHVCNLYINKRTYTVGVHQSEKGF